MRYLRNRPSRDENVRALLTSTVIATAVGLMSFYVTRLLISREALPELTTARLYEPETGGP